MPINWAVMRSAYLVGRWMCRVTGAMTLRARAIVIAMLQRPPSEGAGPHPPREADIMAQSPVLVISRHPRHHRRPRLEAQPSEGRPRRRRAAGRRQLRRIAVHRPVACRGGTVDARLHRAEARLRQDARCRRRLRDRRSWRAGAMRSPPACRNSTATRSRPTSRRSGSATIATTSPSCRCPRARPIPTTACSASTTNISRRTSCSPQRPRTMPARR